FSPGNTANCSTQTGQSLNELPIPITTDDSGMARFISILGTPIANGFINCKAVGNSGAATPGESNCALITSPGCPPTLSVSSQNFDANGGSGSVDVAALGDCKDLTAQSSANWITIGSVTQSNDINPLGKVAFSVAPNPSSGLRLGMVSIND